MKHKIERTNPSTKRFSTRTIAMVLSIVMLIGSIATGSMLSTFAAYLDNAAKADAVTQAAAQGGDIALNAIPSEDNADDAEAKPDLSGLEESSVIKRFKDDLADTGAKVDLATSGNGIEKGKIVYFCNVYDWNTPTIKTWKSGQSDNYMTMTRITNTGIWKWQKNDANYECDGFSFKEYSSENYTSAFNDWVSSDKVYYPNSATDDTTQMNGTAKVISMIKDPATGKYAKASNADCVATISGYNVSGGWYSTSSDSTGTKDTAQMYPAYKSTITYSGADSGIYKFDGLSTTSSTSLPASHPKTMTQQSLYYPGSKTNVSTVYAYFSKIEYETETPDDASSSISSGMLLFEKNGYTPSGAWIWNITGLNNVYHTVTQIGSTKIYKYANDLITSASSPSAIAVSGSTTTDGATSFPNGTKRSGNITKSGDNTSGIYYYQLPDSDKDPGYWTNYTPMAISDFKVNEKTSDEIDEVDTAVTLKATVAGSKKDKAIFYYTTDGSTYYKIDEVSASSGTATCTFYPPVYGSYSFVVTAADSIGLETARGDFASKLSVGEGFYVEGDAGLVAGGGWGTHFATKGAMKETSSGSKVWKVVFPSVASGMHEFRITSLTQDGTYVTDKDNVTVSGNAGAAVVNGSGEDKNNIRFNLLGKSKVTITFGETQSGGKYPVTVDIAEVVGMPVTVYANTGGTATATYGSSTFDVAEGKSNTFTVGEGEVIDLVATPAEGYVFDHWTKNLSNPYKIGDENAGASIYNESIDTKTVYVAAFTKSASTVHPSTTDGATEYTGSLHGLLGPGDDLKNAGTNYDNLKLYTIGSKLYAYIHVGETEVLNKTRSNDTQIKTGKNYYFGVSTSNSGNDLVYQGDGKSVNVSEDDTAADAIKRAEQQEWGGSHIGKFEVNAVAKGDYIRLELGTINESGNLTNTTTGTYVVKYVTSTEEQVDSVVFDPIMNFYAKDSTFSSQSTTEISYLGALDTTVTPVENQVTVDTAASTGQNFECGLALKGSNITVSTTIPHTGSLTALKADGTTETVAADEKYYVAGFSFNGETPELLTEKASEGAGGTTYTCTYKIPETIQGGMLEITPIYFIKDKYASNTATFYINGYEDMLKNGGANWGNTLYIYPFYKRYVSGKTGDTTYFGQAENFGAYPGQPVINYGGQMFTQIPLTCNGTVDGINTNGNPIKGVTINNGYFDGCHKNYCSFVSEHQQTYDYDDFQKIVKEKSAQNGSKYLHSVYFSFKYHAEDTTHQHRTYSTTSTATTDTRYNDMLASGKPGASTTVSTLKSSVENAGNKFEYLTDALGNPVDLFGNPVTVADKTVDPSGEALWVVSMGYEFNNSGQYATEWAVYHTTNGSALTLITEDGTTATGTNSSIVPSALIMNGATSFSNYPQMDGDQPISGYKNMYTQLSNYKNKPVMICYEYDAFINYNSPHAYRSDGRWSYTTVNDYVQSDIKIQYSTDSYAVNDNDKVWTDDSFITDTNQGSTTKAKAYFTNSAYYGKTESTSQIVSNNAADSYAFTAEPSGSYVFAGWYLQDAHGKISKITNEDTSAKTLRSGNFTMIARFQYVDQGNLVISHIIDGDSSGRGTAYLGVTVSNGSEEITLANSASNTKAVTVDNNYIKNTSNYTITIELRTEANGENTFKQYTCNYTNGSNAVVAVDSATAYYNPDNKYSNISTYDGISVKDVIYGGDATQDVKGIEYVSELNPVHYDYNIKYQFKSRAYGDMQFTKSGSLTAGEIGDEDTVTRDGNNRILSKSFLADKAPYESNFMKDINWNFDSVNITQTTTKNDSTNTYTISVVVPLSAEEDTPKNAMRNAYVTVPYALAADKTGVAAIVGDTASGYVNKVEDEEVNLYFTISKPYDSYVKDSDNNTLYAPATLLATNDSGAQVVKFFKYWEVKDHNSTRDSRTLFKCYFPYFNYRLLGDYDIEAVYGENPAETYSELYGDADAKNTSIAFIGNSRNQWNGGKNIDGGMNASAPKTEGDIIYNDFILSFKPEGDDLIKDITGAKYGIIIQKLGAIEVDAKSGKNKHNLLWYEDANKSTKADAIASAEALVGGTAQANFILKQLNTGTNEANDKNRMHYAYSMYNNYTTGDQNYANMKNSKYLYRAFSYMQIGSDITVSENPAYFYMYDEAIK